MRDLRGTLGELDAIAARLSPRTGGRVILFIGASEAVGCSSIAASFALEAAESARRAVWLVDLDLRCNPQFSAFSQGLGDGVGKPGRPRDAALGCRQIYALPGLAQSPETSRLLAVHQIGGSRLFVSRFSIERVASRQRLAVQSAPDWWRRVRQMADWAVIDAPSPGRSRAGLALAAQADAVVIVMRAGHSQPGEVARLEEALGAHGGRVAGVVLNRMPRDSVRLCRLAGAQR